MRECVCVNEIEQFASSSVLEMTSQRRLFKLKTKSCVSEEACSSCLLLNDTNVAAVPAVSSSVSLTDHCGALQVFENPVLLVSAISDI